MRRSYADVVIGNRKEVIIRNNKVHTHIFHIQRIKDNIYKYDIVKVLDDYIIDCKNESLDELADNLKHQQIDFNIMYEEGSFSEPKNQTPLRLAVSRKKLGVVKLLLKCGANPNFTSITKITNIVDTPYTYSRKTVLPSSPLYEAVINNFIEGVRELVDYGVKLAKTEYKDEEWNSSYSYTILDSCLTLVVSNSTYSDNMLRELLRCKNAKEYLNATEYDSEYNCHVTPFQMAVLHNQISKVKTLLEYDIDCNRHIDEGYFLNNISVYGYYEREKGRNNRHIIVFATRLQYHNILELLCSHPKTIFDDTTHDALGIAIWNEDVESVRILLKYIPDTCVVRKELITYSGYAQDISTTYHHILDVIDLPMPKIPEFTNLINIIDKSYYFSKFVREKNKYGTFIDKQQIQDIHNERRKEVTEYLQQFLLKRQHVVAEVTPLPFVLIDLVQQY